MLDSAPPRTGRELRNIQVDRRFQAIPANGVRLIPNVGENVRQINWQAEESESASVVLA
jgi:hypothetical protein